MRRLLPRRSCCTLPILTTDPNPHLCSGAMCQKVHTLPDNTTERFHKRNTKLAWRLTELSEQKNIRVRQWPIIGISIPCTDNKTSILLFLAMFRHWWGCVWFVKCLHSVLNYRSLTHTRSIFYFISLPNVSQLINYKLLTFF